MRADIFKRSSPILKTTLFALVLSIVPVAAQAVQLANGKVFFDQVPAILDASVNFDSVRFPRTKYNFKLVLPLGAQEPLAKITIAQTTRFDSIDFNLDKTSVFVGDRRKQTAEVRSVSRNAEGDIDVVLAQPLPPGTEFTVQLRATRNPKVGGTYLFGITASPAGEKVHAQFLGFARILIFDAGSSNS